METETAFFNEVERHGIAMNILWLITVVAAAMLSGFCLGRVTDRERDASGDNTEDRQHGGRGKNRQSAAERFVGTVGSPVTGEVEDLHEGGRAMVVIRPSEDKIYAPAGGKITKLFPMGNAFLFHTEFGAELYIQAGDSGDELLGRYYRPRIVQNEIVRKGKLLLEFDRQGLEAEGASPRVSMAVETDLYDSDVLAAAGERVKTGEEILRVQSETDDTHRE